MRLRHLSALGLGPLLAILAAGCSHPPPAQPPPVAAAPAPASPALSPVQQTQRAATIQAMRQSAQARGRLMRQRASHQP